MSSDQARTPQENEERRKKLRALEHEMKSYLGVVTMGLPALETVLDKPDDFAELKQTIEEEGVEPLQRIISEIVELAVAATE